MKIFLSAVSAQFKSCRDVLASDLRTVGAEVKVQEEFQQGPGTLLEKLQDYIASCDRVIALVGDAYGTEPQPTEVPPGSPPRSYTQWEYFFALGERLDRGKAARKATYVYFASPEFCVLHAVTQDAEAARGQREFAESICISGKDRQHFDSLDHLRVLVLRDGFRLSRAPRPSNLPYDSIGSLFKGRDTFLYDLRERLEREPRHAAAVVAKQAIHGLGGVGKTRLAVQYALQSQADYCALLFVIGDTRESLRRNLAALCGPMILNLPERDAMEEDIRIAAVLRWLHEHPGWLLILDNVDTRAAAAEVERLLPQFHAGHVLITSCISDWSGSIEPLELDVLSEEDSVAFLLEKTRDRRRATPNDDADARALARQLGGLAVALQQAGAFISQLRVSLADYLRRWRKREAKVLTWHDERLMKYPRSVAVTWDTTSAQLDAPARALLRILCWFAPEPIPRAVLETEATEQALVVGAEWLRASGDLPQADPAQARVEDALAALAGFSLLKWERGNDALHIHRLVEEVTRDRLAEEERQFWLRAALRVANAYLVSDPPPHDVRSWSRWEPLRAHVAAIISAAEAANITSPTGRLMNELGLLLHVKCVWNEAEALYRRAVILAERSFGPDNPQVATCLNNLASLLQATNRLEESESLYRRTLVIDERNLGPDHPTVATHLNNLAQLLQITNRREEAEPLMWRVLAISEHSFGRDHPKVTVGLNNLASLLQDMNRPEEAEVLYRRALAIDEKHLGSSHPNVATGLNNLASLLQATNRMGEAESLYRRGLAIDEQTLGPGHFNVARDLSNLAWLLSVTGRPGEAEPLMWRALAIDESVFGPNHPTVAVRLNNLAMLLQATNRLAEAEPLMRRHLEILLELSAAAGYDYPHLLAGVKNYSALVTQMGCSPDEVLARITAIAQPFGISFASGAGAE